MYVQALMNGSNIVIEQHGWRDRYFLGRACLRDMQLDEIGQSQQV